MLFKKIIKELNLAEPDYFGLQFYRESSSKPVSISYKISVKVVTNWCNLIQFSKLDILIHASLTYVQYTEMQSWTNGHVFMDVVLYIILQLVFVAW